MNGIDVRRELTLRDVLIDVAVSVTLISSAWATKWLAEFLFPAGVPFPHSLILYARDLATLLWVLGTTIRYFRALFHEVNATINHIRSSGLWKRGARRITTLGIKSKLIWSTMSRSSREIIAILLILLLSTGVFSFTHKVIDLVVPPIYGLFFISLAYLLEVSSTARFRELRSLWLILILLAFTALFLFIALKSGVPLNPPESSSAQVNVLSRVGSAALVQQTGMLAEPTFKNLVRLQPLQFDLDHNSSIVTMSISIPSLTTTTPTTPDPSATIIPTRAVYAWDLDSIRWNLSLSPVWLVQHDDPEAQGRLYGAVSLENDVLHTPTPSSITSTATPVTPSLKQYFVWKREGLGLAGVLILLAALRVLHREFWKNMKYKHLPRFRLLATFSLPSPSGLASL